MLPSQERSKHLRTFRLIYLTIKQTLKKPTIICLLLLMPLLSLAIKYLMPSGQEELRITALYVIADEDGNAVNKRHMDDSMEALAKSLESYDGLFVFHEADSVEELNSTLQKGNAECGYIIDEKLYEKMAGKNSRDSIKVIVNDSTTLMPVINETLYAIIFPEAAKNKLIDYIENDSAIADLSGETYETSDIEELYDMYFTNGSTFHFSYDDAPIDYTFTRDSILLSPLRGLLALIILIAGFTGGLAYYKESENPVFAMLRVRFTLITVPVLLLSISALASLIIGGVFTEIPREFLALLVYDAIVILLQFILTIIIKKGSLYAGILPVVILGCLVFTPIFIDLEGIIPILDKLSFIWPTKYYLMFFN